MVHGPTEPASEYDGHIRVTYNDIHITIGKTAKRIKEEFECVLLVRLPPLSQALTSVVRIVQPGYHGVSA